jgi:hypothetical protein
LFHEDFDGGERSPGYETPRLKIVGQNPLNLDGSGSVDLSLHKGSVRYVKEASSSVNPT